MLEAAHAPRTPEETRCAGAVRPVIMVILDGVRPDILRSAVEDGAAPVLGGIAERGVEGACVRFSGPAGPPGSEERLIAA